MTTRVLIPSLLTLLAGAARVWRKKPDRSSRTLDGMRNDGNNGLMFPKAETTFGDCTCTTPCKGSAASYWRCDWCRVGKGCNGSKWSPTRGRYQYCDYPQPAAFESQSAEQKEQQLWENIVANTSSAALLSLKGTLTKIVKTSMNSMFDNHRDVKPDGAGKVIHLQGVACKFEMNISDTSPYTGIFGPGSTHGLMRMGSAAATKGFPGIALKWLRSNVPSGNTVLLRAVGVDDPSENFFEKPLANHVPPPGSLAKLHKFEQATDCQTMTGLSDLCQYDQAGKKVSDVNFPFELFFDPVNPDLAKMPADRENYAEELLKLLSKIPAGTKLYKVMTRACPESPLKQIGEFSSTSKCTTSIFADTTLFFRHQRMEEDFRLKPEWIPKIKDEFCKAGTKPGTAFNCHTTALKN